MVKSFIFRLKIIIKERFNTETITSPVREVNDCLKRVIKRGLAVKMLIRKEPSEPGSFHKALFLTKNAAEKWRV
jgi:hypothetical protein